MWPLTQGAMAEMVDLYRDPQVTEFLVPLDEDGIRRRLEDNSRSWTERGYGPVGLYDRLTRRFLGRSGLHYWPDFDEVEVGWALRADAWGHGYATEAGRAWIEWGLKHLPVDRITANIDPANLASLRVAQRLHMVPARDDVFHGRRVVVHAAFRSPPPHDR